MSKYILITPARNEEDYIEKTIKSVISQKILPERWIIVSDGSTDRTDEIVGQYAKAHSFIVLYRSPNDGTRNFGSKAKAVEFGYEQAKSLDFDYVGNLDADVSFDPDYFPNLIKKFEANEKLGLTGGIRFDLINGKFRETICARNSVGGPFQFFRRECFEAIGGYRPLEYGGIDAVAEISARMLGWEVCSFPEYKVYHYRRTGTAGFNSFRSNFRFGIKHYLIGYHPAFHLAQCVFRGVKRTSLLRPILRQVGYSWAFFRQYKRPVPDEFVTYLRMEQITRLRSSLFKKENFA